MSKTYVTPFDWDFVDDKTLIYNSATSEEEIKEMIGQALDEALEDALNESVDGAVNEAISNMDIKLEGQDLLYKLIVNGSENGEINIPKDQFLKSTSYDSENKKLIFVMQTEDGEATTEVSISDLVASIEEKNQEQDNALAEKADKSELENLATKEEVEAIQIPDVSGFATKEEVQAVDAKVDALEIPSIEGLAVAEEVTAEIAAAVEPLATKEEVQAVDAKVDAIEIPDVSNLASKEEVAAVDEKVEALVIPSIEGLAKAEDVTAEIAAAVEPLATKEQVEALEIPSIEGLAKAEDVTAEIAAAVAPLAVKAEVTEEINAVSSALADFETQIDTAMQAKADASALEALATKEEVNAVDAKVDALVIPSIEGLAKSADVTAEIAAAVEPLATKEELANKVDWVESTSGRKHIVLKNHDSVLGTATDGTTYNVAMVSKWDVADFGSTQLRLNLNSKDGVATINDDKVIATESFVADSIANAIEPLALKTDVESAAASAVAQVVANAPEDFNTLKEVADYIAADKTKATEIETKLSEHDSALEAKADKTELEGVAKAADVTAEIAAAVAPLAVKAEVTEEINAVSDALGTFESQIDTAMSAKANAADVTAEIAAAVAPLALAENVYSKEAADETFLTEHQSLDGYVPVADYNDLKARLDNLEIMLSIYNAEREAQMDEIIANMSADNKEVVIDTLMESIVVPETTTAYKITAPLTDNSTVELTSNKYAYIINTSEKPVSTSISHEYNEETSATTVYLSGQFDTLTLENITIGSSSSIEPATVNAVEIPQTNHQNITLALNFNDGATITNNSEYAVTINNKGEGEGALTIVAPFSTVTLNNGSYTDLDAEVSDDTLVIKKIAHIKNLNVRKGNVRVEVGKESAIADIIERYTIADGYSLDYIHGEITSANVSKLTSEGTWTLAEDINKSGRFAPGIFASDNIVWNLNGHDITFTNTQGYANFLLRGSLQLEINGEGTITNNAGDYGFWAAAEGVKVVINGGTYYAATHVLYAEKGTIEVNGGEFHLTDGDTADKDANGNFKFLLNCKDENYRSGIANIIVKGGKFYDFDPNNCAAEGAGTSFLPETGYVSVESTEIIDGVEHKVYTVQAAS